MRLTITLLAALFAGYWLTGIAEIRPGERAVVRRFGRVVATPGPGLWVGLPWGMDRIDRVLVDRVRRVEVGYQAGDDAPEAPAGQLLTGDHNLVNVAIAAYYSVEDTEVVSYVEQADRVDSLVARATETALAQWVAGHGIDDILLHGKTALPAFLLGAAQERLTAYRLGVRVQSADVLYLFPPDEVRSAFDEVTRAQTGMRTREHEARQEAARLLREAETERFRLEKETEAYQVEQVRLAHAEAERFNQRLEQYRRLRADNPSFLAGLWWEEMGKLFAQLKEKGRIDLLDHHLGPDGLDITIFPPMPKK